MNAAQGRPPTAAFVHWQGGELWVGSPDESPDDWTQGETPDDLKDHLRDLHLDLSGGVVPAFS